LKFFIVTSLNIVKSYTSFNPNDNKNNNNYNNNKRAISNAP